LLKQRQYNVKEFGREWAELLSPAGRVGP